jgi:hypothetical protein
MAPAAQGLRDVPAIRPLPDLRGAGAGARILRDEVLAGTFALADGN